MFYIFIIYIYLTKLHDFTHTPLQNLEYFHTTEAMHDHISLNPCITYAWDQLWMVLSSNGWKRIEQKTDTTSSSKGSNSTGDSSICYCLQVDDKYIPSTTTNATTGTSNTSSSIATELLRGLVPGVHLFTSKLAVIQYIAR